MRKLCLRRLDYCQVKLSSQQKVEILRLVTLLVEWFPDLQLAHFTVHQKLGKHLICIHAEVRIGALRIRRVQVLFDETCRVNLVIVGLMQDLDGLFAINVRSDNQIILTAIRFSCLNLLDKVSAFLFTGLLMAH